MSYQNSKVIALTKEIMKQYLPQIVELDRSLIEKMGELYSNISWDEENFLLDLKGKWNYSKIVFKKENLIGFWVVSTIIPRNIHTHRVAIEPTYQGKGIGKIMFHAIIDDVLKRDKIDYMTLEVNTQNINAVNFYEKLGFIRMKKPQINNYLLKKERQALIFNDFLREKDQSEFYVYKMKIRGIK